jgi:hypothetical protein
MLLKQVIIIIIVLGVVFTQLLPQLQQLINVVIGSSAERVYNLQLSGISQ